MGTYRIGLDKGAENCIMESDHRIEIPKVLERLNQSNPNPYRPQKIRISLEIRERLD